jgi:hypothetical protein
MNHLLISINKDDYDNFCIQYTKCIEQNLYFSLDISYFTDIDSMKAIKYIEFMLYKNPYNYNVSYIDYLIENGFSDNLITFIESLRNNTKPQSIASEMVIADHIAFLVNRKKDDKLFDYLMDNPVKDWSTYKSHQRLFNHFVMYDYEYSINRFYSRKTNPQYYFIDYFSTALTSEIEEKKYPHFERLGIKDPKLLLEIIRSQSQGVYFNMKVKEPEATTRSGFVIMKSRPPAPSKAKEIWLRYILESDLGEKTQEKNKSSKI